MLHQKEIEILGDIFKDYDYVMTTAQLSSVKLYYRDIQRMLNEGLLVLHIMVIKSSSNPSTIMFM